MSFVCNSRPPTPGARWIFAQREYLRLRKVGDRDRNTSHVLRQFAKYCRWLEEVDLADFEAQCYGEEGSAGQYER